VGRRLPEHVHETAFFSLLVRGGYWEEIGGRRIEYRPGTVVFHPAALPHRDEIGAAGGSFFCVEVEEELLARLEGKARQAQAIVAQGGRMSDLARRLYDELRAGDRCGGLAMEGLGLELLAEVGRLGALVDRLRPAWLERLAERLRHEFVRPPSLVALAAAEGVHPVRAARAFRRFFGQSVGEYVQTLRLAYVSERLADPEVDLADLALAAGFFDQSHLTRFYKRHTGLTPGAFRARLAGGQRAG
jgi:AraC family transcriptional regulator